MSASRDPVELLSAIDLFGEMSRLEAKHLVEHGREVTYAKGQRVAIEGDSAHAFHLILSGRATVGHGSRPIRTVAEGDYFGEISMIDGEPRSATVTVDEDMRALVIEHGVFETLLWPIPSSPGCCWRGCARGCARRRRGPREPSPERCRRWRPADR